MTNPLQQLQDLGQSIWLDSIKRSYLGDDGYLAGLIAAGEIDGLTSNPSIFEKALADDPDGTYEEQVAELRGTPARDALWAIIKRDLTAACDLFLPLYRSSGGTKGFASIEIDPSKAFDTEATVADGLMLFRDLDRPNLLVKVPGTESGLEAITRLIAEGVNVNVTLLFDVARYEAVADAYLEGVRRLRTAGGDLSAVQSVASFFVSRVDGKVDAVLGEGSPRVATAAIANARVAYRSFRRKFSTPEWEELAAAGATLQRPLWASTSTKDPALPDTLYVDELAAPDTVNTMPEVTLDAVRDHGSAEDRVSGTGDEAEDELRTLAEQGVDLPQITKELEADGVEKFVTSFDAAVDALAERLR